MLTIFFLLVVVILIPLGLVVNSLTNQITLRGIARSLGLYKPKSSSQTTISAQNFLHTTHMMLPGVSDPPGVDPQICHCSACG